MWNDHDFGPKYSQILGVCVGSAWLVQYHTFACGTCVYLRGCHGVAFRAPGGRSLRGGRHENSRYYEIHGEGRGS